VGLQLAGAESERTCGLRKRPDMVGAQVLIATPKKSDYDI
jgi:hypothetical protein